MNYYVKCAEDKPLNIITTVNGSVSSVVVYVSLQLYIIVYDLGLQYL